MENIYSKESGRKLIKKKNKEDLETVIIDYIESDKKDTFKERFFIWVERQKICGRSDNTVAKYESDYRRFLKVMKSKICHCGKLRTVRLPNT